MIRTVRSTAEERRSTELQERRGRSSAKLPRGSDNLSLASITRITGAVEGAGGIAKWVSPRWGIGSPWTGRGKPRATCSVDLACSREVAQGRAEKLGAAQLVTGLSAVPKPVASILLIPWPCSDWPH